MIKNESLLMMKLYFGNFCCIAQTQMGKSTKIAEIIKRFMRFNTLSHKCFIYNTQRFKAFREIGVNVNSFESFLQSFSTNQITVFNPKLSFLQVTEHETFSKIIRTLFLTQNQYAMNQPYKQKRIIVVVDEIHQFLPKFEKTKVPELKLILSRGLNPYHIQLFTICQNIQQTDNLVFSESNAMIVGKLEKYFWDFARKYKSKLPKKLIEKKYQFLFVDSNDCFEI